MELVLEKDANDVEEIRPSVEINRYKANLNGYLLLAHFSLTLDGNEQ